jgi:hypothetical protein
LGNLLGIKDSGGYVDKGIYRMAWDSRREFVMSGSTTKAAERALGGSLSQDNLLAAIAMANGQNKSVEYYDNRRMPNQGVIDREKLRKDMQDVIRNELKFILT